MTRLIGPIRKERAVFSVSIKEREVLLDKLYDPEDQLELMAKSFMDRKLSVLALQLQMRGAGEEEVEGLLRKILSHEKFSILDISRFVDLMGRRIGDLRDPALVIGAIFDNVVAFQPDANHAIVMAGVLIEDFVGLKDSEEERKMAAGLKGN